MSSGALTEPEPIGIAGPTSRAELTEITECKPPVTLFTLWSLLQDVIDLPREIYRVRYRSLLEQSALRDLGHP